MPVDLMELNNFQLEDEIERASKAKAIGDLHAALVERERRREHQLGLFDMR